MAASFLRTAALVAAIVGLVAACGATADAGGPAPSAPAGGAVVVASGMAFDRTNLSVRAGQPFALLFVNRDSTPHNVSVLGTSGESVFSGEVFGGSSSRTYQLPAIPEGTYRFQCDVHPDMAGTLIATPAPPEPAAAPAPIAA